MAEIIKDCPYIQDMCGVPICRLNVLPCERVSQELCDLCHEDEHFKVDNNER